MLVSPFTGGAVREILDTQPYTFRGEEFEVTAPVYECVDSGEQFTTNEQDEEFMNRLHTQWRVKYRVPTPEQLRARREELELSAREMSDLLGLGVNQYRQYEGGELPSKSNVLLLGLVTTASGLASIVAQQEHLLPERTLRKLRPLVEKAAVPVLFMTPLGPQQPQPRVQQELSRQQLMEPLAHQGGQTGTLYTQQPTNPQRGRRGRTASSSATSSASQAQPA